MKKRDIVSVGFMLFAMFFGAGNLIFPPALGFQSGEFFWTAILGFVITGVGLPLLAVLVGSVSEGGYRESFKNIHPVFSIVLLSAIYLTIGPFFAIPRTATTSYEMAVAPFVDGGGGNMALLIFSIIFFGVVLFISLKPSKLSDAIGRFLTPILLLFVLALIIAIIFMYSSNNYNAVAESFNAANPFSHGFIEGYLTMDAIAAIAFSLMVTQSIRYLGVHDRKEQIKGSVKAALLAAGLLGVIYIALGWGGAFVDLNGAIPDGQNLGTALLSIMSGQAFGGFGVVLLGLIMLLACLTTATGLISSVAGYFHNLIPKVSYSAFAVIFTLISLLISNQGLNQVISASEPILSVLYPIAMTSVLLVLVSKFVPSSKLSLQLTAGVITVLSLGSTLHRSGIINLEFLEMLPLFESQLEWIPIAVVVYLIGLAIGHKKPAVTYS